MGSPTSDHRRRGVGSDHSAARFIEKFHSRARRSRPYGHRGVTQTEEVRYMARNNRKKPARTLLEKRRAKQEKRAAQAVRERKRDRLQRAVGA